MFHSGGRAFSQHIWRPRLLARSWAVPLGSLKPEAIEALCAKTQVGPEDVDPLLETLLSSAELASADHIALLA